MEQSNQKSKNQVWLLAAMLFILFSGIVGYSYVRAIKEKNSIERERIDKEIRLIFLNECINARHALADNFDKMTFEQRMGSARMDEISCENYDWVFDISNFNYCEHSVLQYYNEESWVRACIGLKMSQIE